MNFVRMKSHGNQVQSCLLLVGPVNVIRHGQPLQLKAVFCHMSNVLSKAAQVRDCHFPLVHFQVAGHLLQSIGEVTGRIA